MKFFEKFTHKKRNENEGLLLFGILLLLSGFDFKRSKLGWTIRIYTTFDPFASNIVYEISRAFSSEDLSLLKKKRMKT